MAKFYGPVGYAQTIESAPGVSTERIVEHNYSGDILRETQNHQSGKYLNDDLRLSHRISIVSDAFAYENVHAMRYVKLDGVSWKISAVEVSRPRLILTIGGVYNVPTN